VVPGLAFPFGVVDVLKAHLAVRVLLGLARTARTILASDPARHRPDRPLMDWLPWIAAVIVAIWARGAWLDDKRVGRGFFSGGSE